MNVATRQLLFSDTRQQQTPPTPATTLDRGIDVTQVKATMQSELVNKALASILTRTFPITVVAKDGTNVVLSQGGLAVKQGARYDAVSLGKEIIDPQTQQTLGHLETHCCDVVIDRVTQNLAYGHIENPKIPLDSLAPSAIKLGEELKAATPQAVSTADAPMTSTPPVTSAAPITAIPTPTPADDKKW